MPSKPLSAWDAIAGLVGHHHGGTLEAAAMAAASAAARQFGPRAAGLALKGAAKGINAIPEVPPQLLVGAIQAARGAAQGQRPQEDWLDAYLREKQAQVVSH